MQKDINYIYNDKGLAEYAVVPIKIWKKVEPLLEKDESKTKVKQNKINPKEYFGLISHLNLNIEQELIDIRDEWTRNI